MSYPVIIILDVATEVRAFKDSVKDNPCSTFFHPDSAISQVFDYVVSPTESFESLCDMAQEVKDLFFEEKPAYAVNDVEAYGSAVLTFGTAVVDKLRAAKAYEDNNTFLYNFDQFIGDDIVLRRENPDWAV